MKRPERPERPNTNTSVARDGEYANSLAEYIEYLESKIENIQELLSQCPELNMLNYDHDDVEELNNAVIEIHNEVNTI